MRATMRWTKLTEACLSRCLFGAGFHQELTKFGKRSATEATCGRCCFSSRGFWNGSDENGEKVAHARNESKMLSANVPQLAFKPMFFLKKAY